MSIVSKVAEPYAEALLDLAKSNDSLKETTNDKGEPYYPVLNEENINLYNKYKKMSEKENKIQDLLKLAEEELNKTEANDQNKYLVDQKIEVLKNLN